MHHLASAFKKRQKGFTLIELLVVMSILTALTITVFVALNPAKRIRDANNNRRATDIESILTSIHTYVIDNNGSYPTGLAASTQITQLGTAATGCEGTVGSCTIVPTACLNLSSATTGLGKYLTPLPFDPKTGSAATSQYAVTIDANGIVTVTSCGAEGTTLTVSR